VDVNAENGIVYLRGEVDSQDLVAELEQATRNVHGVREVENQLHATESSS
jgi:osmotically-inducible protein OsmY